MQPSPLDRNSYSKARKKTLQALELHLVSTDAFIEALGFQLPGKEDGDSSSTKTELQSLNGYLMGTSFSKLHPKIQQKKRLAIRTLPPEIQQNILTHKAITSSYDRWMYLFKVLVSTTFIRTEDMTVICGYLIKLHGTRALEIRTEFLKDKEIDIIPIQD